MSGFESDLLRAFGADRVGRGIPLAPLTTFRVGGPADWLIETRSSEEIVTAMQIARAWSVPVTLLGGGSNMLVADAGVRGLVVRPRGGAVAQIGEKQLRADAAVTVNGLVRWTISRGCAGLEAWAGTPGTVGGAIAGNAHFGGRLIGDVVVEVRVVDRTGRVLDIPRAQMGFGYDTSRVQRTGEVVLSAVFTVSAGDPAAMRERARESLAFRKRTQPLESRSAGCVFQNPQPGRDQVPEGVPWSAGALVDRAGLKGVAIGGARVSPTHGNFIVNDGSATAEEIRQLIDRCKTAVRNRFGVELEEEIIYVGAFSPAPLVSD
jgi:UDP-N-acetylmuramate dehydrogenase